MPRHQNKNTKRVCSRCGRLRLIIYLNHSSLNKGYFCINKEKCIMVAEKFKEKK